MALKLQTSDAKSNGKALKTWICVLNFLKVDIMAQLVKNPPGSGRPGFHPWVGKIPWRRERLPIPVFWPGEFQGLYSPWGRRVRHD